MVKCTKCGHDPVNEEKVMDEHANDVAAYIDKEAYDMIMRKAMIETAKKVAVLEKNILMMREENGRR